VDTQFEAFIRERQYLSNVSPRTIQWYRESFKWLGTPPTDERTLKAFVQDAECKRWDGMVYIMSSI